MTLSQASWFRRPIAALALAISFGAIVGCDPPAKPPSKPIDKSGEQAETKPSIVIDDAGKPEEEPKTVLKPADEPAKPAEPSKSVEEVADSSSAKKGAAPGVRVLLGSPDLTAGIPGEGPLKHEDIEAWLADPKNHETLDVELPLGLSAGQNQLKGLDKNPLTRAKIELGRQLYFDNRLSGDRTVSCASCHDPDQGFAAHTQFGVGINKQTGGRNSPVSYNRILSDNQFWDGRAESLEDQAIGPIANVIEMGNSHDACVECLKAIPGYKSQFDKIFGEMNILTIGKALAAFERVIVSGPSPFDYQVRFEPLEKLDPEDLKADDPDLFVKYQAYKADTEKHPMSESAKRGQKLFFGKANCTACHVGPNLADEKYHNIGIGMDKPEPDLGRSVFSMDDKDRGAFKTPTVRNVAQSFPYMHDGSVKTLEEVVEWYNKGGHPNPSLSDKIKKLDLNDEEKHDLVEFMKACTGDFPKIERGRMPEEKLAEK